MGPRRAVAPRHAGPPPGRIWLFFGGPGQGKSTGANVWIDCLLAADERAIALIHDPHGANEAGKGYRGRVWRSIDEFRRAPALERRNVFRFGDPLPLAPLALELGRRVPVILVIDELDRVIAKGGEFKDGGQGGPLYQIANEGRHLRIALVGTARRAARVGTDLPANAEGLFLHRLRGRADKEWCKEVCDVETATAVGKLRKFHGLMYDGDGYVRPYVVEPGALRWRRHA